MQTEAYSHWKGEGVERGTIVIKKKQNKVHIPDEIEGAKQNHIYTDVVDQNGQPGKAYIAVPYERSENSFPKMVFHPDYHKELPPNRNYFKETHDFEMALKNWSEKFDRFRMAGDEKEEKRLLGKGWLPKPPIVEVEKSNPNSDEI